MPVRRIEAIGGMAKPGRKQRPVDGERQRTEEVPFRSYALDRTDGPRFHIRFVENTRRLYPAHMHDYFQILYFTAEAPSLRIGLTLHKPVAGSIYFVAPMVSHQVRFDHATRCIVLYFDLDFLRPGVPRSYPIAELVRLAPELTPFAWQNHLPFNLLESQKQGVERAMHSMMRQAAGDSAYSSEVIRAELSLMLASLCQDHEAEFAELAAKLPIAGRDSGHMRRISEFIGTNYIRGPSLEEAARAVHLSRSRLCALVRQYTGTTFNMLIRELRIEDAREQLVLTNDPIGKIAYGVGYQDEKYFLRAFKNSVGMTPTAYRVKKTVAMTAPAADRASPVRSAAQANGVRRDQ